MQRLAVLGLGVLLTACNGEKVEGISGPTMGSTYRIQYVADGTSPSKSQILTAVSEILETLDRNVSTYRRDSEVSRFNALPANSCQPIPNSTIQLYTYAQELHRESHGAYDITLLPALSAWGFGPQGRVDHAPSQSQLNALQAITGMQHIRFKDASGDTPKSLCKDSDSSIEFNSIAAGAAVDRIVEYLETRGINSYLVEITGELKAKGQKPDGSGWRIALEAPISNVRAAQRIVTLNGQAASTSGDYRDYYEENGVRYSHTLDPRTLSPVTHNLASVSVVSQSAMQADGLSTLLMVLGPQHGYDFAVQHHLSALFVISNSAGDKAHGDRTFTVRTTPRFEEQFPSLKGKP